MGRELTLRVVLERPPAGADYAVQKGRGKVYTTLLKQRSTGDDLTFEFAVDLKDGSGDVMRRLAGPVVQGPAEGRFVYIDIGTYAGQADCVWERRLKVPLSGITAEMVESGGVLEARIPGVAKDGGPACGTVRPVGGWVLVASEGSPR